jgi:hypothetical protein
MITALNILQVEQLPTAIFALFSPILSSQFSDQLMTSIGKSKKKTPAEASVFKCFIE